MAELRGSAASEANHLLWFIKVSGQGVWRARACQVAGPMKDQSPSKIWLWLRHVMDPGPHWTAPVFSRRCAADAPRCAQQGIHGPVRTLRAAGLRGTRRRGTARHAAVTSVASSPEHMRPVASDRAHHLKRLNVAP
ncbi:hypothetical protein ACCO45_002995 [Purpureocillium lilacinum]|uniref:Uncharacterized protein n=1 Tax=Purpureocillium lilacinum TaxID=33203 RepID=A0ACC4DZY2_PURLI